MSTPLSSEQFGKQSECGCGPFDQCGVCAPSAKADVMAYAATARAEHDAKQGWRTKKKWIK